ncbi:hypothetical protein HanIR_Chr02g0055981 [Helianthus annuus]|nr:hypothetical protein HanIR_Chr02g0055981 [Helianthus annuus]
MTFRNVNETILAESIEVAAADTVNWFPQLRTIEFKKLDNSQLWVLRMMLTRPSRKARPVVREKSGGNLGALGDFEVKSAPKKHVRKKHVRKKHVEKIVRGRHRKKHEPAVVPPLVPQAAGISCSRFRRYTDYVVVSDTLEGLGVPGGGAAAGGSSAGSKPADEKRKRNTEEKAAGAGEKKRPRLQTKRTTGVPQTKPAVEAGK